jgi:Helix-turn-helix domain
MGRTAWLQDRRMQKFRDVLSRWERGDLSMMEAGELLGMSERQFRRYRDRYEEAGLEGLCDRRLGKPSAKRVPEDERQRMLELYESFYGGWNVNHFHEHLRAYHSFAWGYTWTKAQLHAAGLVERARRRGAHRRKRPRKPCEGMLLHQDGSRFAWLEGQPMLDLVVTMDDATSTIYSAFLVEEEGTASSFRGLLETFSAKGLPSSVYTDRGSHYFYTAKAGEKVDKSVLTQVGRALDKLGIEHIPAYSPEARGRSERMFGTLQDRLPKELKLAGITAIEAANAFIAAAYLPAHNARFSRPPEIAESGFVAADPAQLREMLCVEEERVVARDNTVGFGGLRLQLPESRLRHHYVKASVKVRQYPDGRLAIFHGPRCIGRYDRHGHDIAIPTSASLGRCFAPSQDGPPPAEAVAASARRPTLTASPLAASADAWVGTKKRAARSNQETNRKTTPATP